MTDGRRLDREGALELLRSQHTFPGLYVFRVVVRPGDTTGVLTAIAASLNTDSAVREVQEQPSRAGRYVSLRIHAELDAAETVLEVYDVIGRLDTVIMTL